MATDPAFSPDPIIRDFAFRVEMTAACRDSAAIPKVPDAGRIVMEDGQRIQIMHNGVKVVAGGYYGDWTEEIIRRLKGHHEPQEELVFHELLRHIGASAVMIELGGFWCYYSLWFLSHFPAERRAVVVEPDPKHLAVGQANARLNGRAIDFLQASAGASYVAQQDFKAEASGLVTVPQVSVEYLLEKYAIAKLDILHCDIQGAETVVLDSCRELFREKRIQFCVVSTHAHHISGDPLTHQRCLAILKEAGGRIIAEHDVHESFSGDGLIAAYFGDEAIDWPNLPISYNRYSTSLFRNPLFDLDEVINASGRGFPFPRI
jgi:FkbM family methyltransferase